MSIALLYNWLIFVVSWREESSWRTRRFGAIFIWIVLVRLDIAKRQRIFLHTPPRRVKIVAGKDESAWDGLRQGLTKICKFKRISNQCSEIAEGRVFGVKKDILREWGEARLIDHYGGNLSVYLHLTSERPSTHNPGESRSLVDSVTYSTRSIWYVNPTSTTKIS